MHRMRYGEGTGRIMTYIVLSLCVYLVGVERVP